MDSSFEFVRNIGLSVLQALAYYAGFLVLERLHPAQRGQPLSAIALNVMYLPCYLIGTALLLPPVTALLVGALRASHPEIFGLLAVDSHVATGLRGIVFLFVYDFAYYWFHRTQHRFGFLWAQHKLHHSDLALNVTTTYRHHWLEEPLKVLFVTLPIAILFDLTPTFSAGVAFALSFWGFYIHTNVGMHLGWFNRVLCSPQLHRLHHSTRPEHQDRNFAAIFPVFDWLFGTQALPRRGDVPETGLVSGERVTSVWQANALPFSTFMDWLRAKRSAH